MRIRRDVTFISAVLFTIALAAWVPWSLSLISTWRREYLEFSDAVSIQNFYPLMGFAGLAFVLIGLIVTWSGYMQRSRWAWFVMFIIVWVYVFPAYMLPVVRVLFRTDPARAGLIWDAVKDAAKHGGPNRDFLKAPLDFLLMLVALFLPVGSFFRRRPAAQATGS